METETTPLDTKPLVAQIVSAYVAHNPIQADGLPALIAREAIALAEAASKPSIPAGCEELVEAAKEMV